MIFDENIMKACVYGTAVGDALGVPFEFKDRDSFVCDGMVGGGTYDKPAGTWSDDTAMTIATVDMLATCESIDVPELIKKFRRWYINGEFACNGDVFDVGNTTRHALTTFSPRSEITDCGNGSLMRISPLGLINGITEQNIYDVSAATHAHTLVEHTCATWCNCITLAAFYRCDVKSLFEHTYGFITALPRESIKSTGYCVDTFEAAIWCFVNTDNFADCVLTAVNLGGDTDTTAAVVGALAGVAYGFDAIPSEWIDILQDKDTINACFHDETDILEVNNEHYPQD